LDVEINTKDIIIIARRCHVEEGRKDEAWMGDILASTIDATT